MDAGPRIAIDAMGGDTGPAAIVAGIARARRQATITAIPAVSATKADPRRTRQAWPARSEVTVCPHARIDRCNRKAEPGDPPRQDHFDGSGDQRREGWAGRRGHVRRQYRRADGHVEARAAHDAGHRPACACRLASDARRARLRHARPRREHRMRRPEPGPVRGDGIGLCADRARHRQAAGETAQHRHRRTQGHGRTQGGRGACCARPIICRSGSTDSSKATSFRAANVDVVVTDGFSGNIALKTAEGTARFVTDLLRRAFKSSLRSKAGFALSKPALNLLKRPPRSQQS